jgi:hypothetical protein
MEALEEPNWVTDTRLVSGGRVGLVGLAGIGAGEGLVKFVLFLFSSIVEPSASTGNPILSGSFEPDDSPLMSAPSCLSPRQPPWHHQ